jgi:hypothetical protein
VIQGRQHDRLEQHRLADGSGDDAVPPPFRQLASKYLEHRTMSSDPRAPRCVEHRQLVVVGA